MGKEKKKKKSQREELERTKGWGVSDKKDTWRERERERERERKKRERERERERERRKRGQGEQRYYGRKQGFKLPGPNHVLHPIGPVDFSAAWDYISKEEQTTAAWGWWGPGVLGEFSEFENLQILESLPKLLGLYAHQACYDNLVGRWPKRLLTRCIKTGHEKPASPSHGQARLRYFSVNFFGSVFKTGTPKRSTSQIYLHFFVFVRGCQNSKKCKQICDVLIKGLIKPPYHNVMGSVSIQSQEPDFEAALRKTAGEEERLLLEIVSSWPDVNLEQDWHAEQPGWLAACVSAPGRTKVYLAMESWQPGQSQLTASKRGFEAVYCEYNLVLVTPKSRPSSLQRQFVSGLPPGPSSFSKKTTRPGISSDPECQAKLAWDPRHWVEFPGLIV